MAHLITLKAKHFWQNLVNKQLLSLLTFVRMADHGFVIDGSHISVKEVVSRLIFISKFKKDYKVNVDKMCLEKNSQITNLNRRYITHGSRNKTLAFIESTMGDALEIVSQCKNKDEFHAKIAEMVIHSLEESKKGMSELCQNESYKTDAMFVSRVETCIQLLNVKIENIKSQTPKVPSSAVQSP